MAQLKLDIRKLLVLSTAHITPQEGELLNNWTPEKFDIPFACGPFENYGWLIFVNLDIDEEIGWQDFPNIWILFQYAQRHNCDFILLDKDGPLVEDLTIFKWE